MKNKEITKEKNIRTPARGESVMMLEPALLVEGRVLMNFIVQGQLIIRVVRCVELKRENLTREP